MVNNVFPPEANVCAPTFFTLDGISIYVRLSQCLMEAVQSSLMPEGRIILVKDLQRSNVSLDKLSSPIGSIASFRLSHSAKASSPIHLIVVGNSTLTNFAHPLNARFPMISMLSDNSTFVRLSHLLNTSSPSFLKLPGKLIVKRSSQPSNALSSIS